MEPNQVYTIKQVAEYLKMSYGWVYGEIVGGKIPAVRLGNQYRLRGEDVLKLTEGVKS